MFAEMRVLGVSLLMMGACQVRWHCAGWKQWTCSGFHTPNARSLPPNQRHPSPFSQAQISTGLGGASIQTASLLIDLNAADYDGSTWNNRASAGAFSFTNGDFLVTGNAPNMLKTGGIPSVGFGSGAGTRLETAVDFFPATTIYGNNE